MINRLFLGVLIVAALLSSLTSAAQVRKDEVGLSLGLWPFGSSSQVYDELYDDIDASDPISGLFVDLWNEKASGIISVDWFHRMSRRLSVGAVVGYSPYSETNTSTWDGVEFSFEGRAHTFFLAPQARWVWVSTSSEGFRFYSRVAVGASIEHATIDQTYTTDLPKHTSRTGVRFMAQFSPLGIDWGGSHFRGFAEIGTGYQGMFVAGVRYAF